jgi:predicted ribosome quality control (RQC) complex YloA/Tae2 family protein
MNTSTADTAAQSAAEQIRAVRNKVKALIKHEDKKLSKQRGEVREAGQYVRYGQIADSLMADPGAAVRGTAKGAVENIHTGEIEEITLNPAFDAVQNAELLYRKARRGKRGHETAVAMATATEANLNKLNDILLGINAVVEEKEAGAIDEADAERVREIAAEFLPADGGKAGAKRKDLPPPPPFKRYVIDGWEVYLGKNSKQNDELSTRFARPSDVWMHVVGYAGSHLIIRRRKNDPEPPKEVVQKAAQLAVWFSKAKHTSFAEVHVTEARFVRKRRHAPPGEVIAERCRAVRVEPKDPQFLDFCKNNNMPQVI